MRDEIDIEGMGGMAAVSSMSLAAQGTAPAPVPAPVAAAAGKPAEPVHHGSPHPRDHSFARALQQRLAGRGGHFHPNGTVQGWMRDQGKAERAMCPARLGEDHAIDNGVCGTAVVVPIAGRYTIKGNQVCMSDYPGKPQDGEACHHFAFVTKLVMIGDGKRTCGSGKDLVVGRVLDTFRKRLDRN